MKTIAITLFVLVLSYSATAQYAHDPANDTGIYTAETKNGDKMTITRNAEKNNFIVDYQLMEEFNKAVLVVNEPIGKIIVMEDLENANDQVLITTDNWPSGQYTFSLFADKKTILTKQISLIK